MKGQIKLGLLAVALTALLTALALPALAGAAVKVTVLAAEYNNNLFVATVLAVATAGEDPSDWEVALSVSGDAVEDLIFKGARLWKIVAKGDVVKPGDLLTATVSEGGVELGSDTATCGAGLPRLRITAICR